MICVAFCGTEVVNFWLGKVIFKGSGEYSENRSAAKKTHTHTPYAIFTSYASAIFLEKIADFVEISRNLRVFETKLKRKYTAKSGGASSEILI